MALLDRMGATQVVVAWLRREQKQHPLRLLDLSESSSIEGGPDAFYDGFHVKRANARRLVRTVVTAFTEAFGGPAGAED